MKPSRSLLITQASLGCNSESLMINIVYCIDEFQSFLCTKCILSRLHASGKSRYITSPANSNGELFVSRPCIFSLGHYVYQSFLPRKSRFRSSTSCLNSRRTLQLERESNVVDIRVNLERWTNKAIQILILQWKNIWKLILSRLELEPGPGEPEVFGFRVQVAGRAANAKT